MFYDNLPGINVTLKDGGLIIPESGGSESMLIIAPSLSKDAPEEPVLIRNSSELVEYGFGDFYVHGEANPIAIEWKAAVDGGCKIVYLAALKEIDLEVAAELEQNAIDAAVENGVEESAAEAKYMKVLTGDNEMSRMRRKYLYFYDLMMNTLLDFSVDHVVLKGATIEDQVTDLDPAFFPEAANIEEYPNIGGIIVSSHIIQSGLISYPVAIEADTNDELVVEVGGETLTFKLEEKTYDGRNHTLSDLVVDIQKVINEHSSNINLVVREESSRIALYFEEEAKIADGTTAVELNLKGKSAWYKTSFGLIQRGSFGQVIADYCSTKTLLKDACVGYIGVKSPVDTKVSAIRKYVDELMEIDTEMSPYLQVVGAEAGVTMPVTNSIQYINGATHYAALVSTLKKESAPTNKPVKGVSSIRFDYSLRQLSRLTSKKIVTFRLKDSNLIVTDGVTSAPSLNIEGRLRDSDYSRLSTLRITQLAIQTVREAVDPFVGEANQMPQYNALNTAIKSALEKIREAGAIRGYKFSIANLTARLDQATVILEIVPAYELRRIEVQVSLVPSDDMLESLATLA